MNESVDVKDNMLLLKSMMADMKSQSGLYKPGKYWERYSNRIVSSIYKYGIKDFRSNVGISKGYADVCVTDPLDLLVPGSISYKFAKILVKIYPVSHIYKKFYDLNKTQLRETAHFKSLFYSCGHSWIGDLIESGVLNNRLAGSPTTCVEVNGSLLGDAHVRALVWQKILSENIDFEKTKVALEIGGGFGAFAHTLLTTRKSIKKYVYIDIPPMLYVGTQYLKAIFGNKVRDYLQTRDLAELKFADDDSTEVLAICPWQLEKLNVKVDFFFNSASFQEMPCEIVSNYARKISYLMDDGGKIFLYIYKRKESKRVLGCGQIVDIFKKHANVELVELEKTSIQDIIPGYYLCAK